MPDLTPLLIAEYEGHRARHRQLSQETASLQHYAIIFSAGLWAWILTNVSSQTEPYLVILIWLPVFLTVLYMFKAFLLHIVVNRIRDRLGLIEYRLGASMESGYFLSESRDVEKQGHVPFGLWLLLFWFLILISNVVVTVSTSCTMPVSIFFLSAENKDILCQVGIEQVIDMFGDYLSIILQKIRDLF